MRTARDEAHIAVRIAVRPVVAADREETGELLKRIVNDHIIVVIEHDMEFMRTYADFVTVMHSGKVLAEGTVAEIQADKRVQQVYLGTVAEVALDA